MRPAAATPKCDICKRYDACASVNGYAVCSQACADKATAMEEGGSVVKRVLGLGKE